MYGLPESFTGEAYIGRVLASVTVYSNQLMFSFGDGASLRLESCYSVDSPGEAGTGASAVRRVPMFDGELMRLMDRRIVRASPRTNGTLQFAFENQYVLTVFDDDPRYEAYHLAWDGQELTV